MSDDLVQRLRDGCSCNIDTNPCMAEEECRDAFAAAARIEELDKACSEWADASQANYQRARAAEAKLAKAVELLAFAVEMAGEDCHLDHHGYCQAHNLQPQDECWVGRSQALIAELTGGKDE